MTKFTDNPPQMSIPYESIAYFIRNGYDLRLCNRRAIKANASNSRILIPVIPVCGATLRKDYDFWTEDDWREHAEEAGCIKFNVTTDCDLMCEFSAHCGVLLQMREVYDFIMSYCDMDEFYAKCRARLAEFSQEGLADTFSKLTRNPTNISGRNIHVGAMLRIIDLIEHDTLLNARRAFLDLTDFSKEGIRQFCIKNKR